jgi:hypothetical protein
VVVVAEHGMVRVVVTEVVAGAEELLELQAGQAEQVH